MSDDGWVEVPGIDLASAQFPTLAELDGETIALFRLQSAYRAVQALCPHQLAPMIKAVIAGSGALIRCPLHNFIFRLNDGAPVNCPSYRLQVFDIREQDGRLWGRPAHQLAPTTSVRGPGQSV